jgi:uroporphyrinogen-III synthase
MQVSPDQQASNGSHPMNKPIKTLLMIRAYDQAVGFVAELDVPNPVVYSPMVIIEPLDTDKDLPNTATVIFTSSNAVRLYASLTTERRQNILCVGSITSQAASRLGFTVSHSFEIASKLVIYLKQENETIGDIFYPRAETISVDIAKALSKSDKSISERVLYRQNFQPLSDEGRDVIESLPVIAPILSKEVAFRFRDAIQRLKPKDLTIICISHAVASVFDDLSNFRLEIAQKPNRVALIEQIKINVSA